MNIDDKIFWNLVLSYMERWPKMRQGQAVYNAAAFLYPAAAETIRHEIDPFYQDILIGPFLKKLQERLS